MTPHTERVQEARKLSRSQAFLWQHRFRFWFWFSLIHSHVHVVVARDVNDRASTFPVFLLSIDTMRYSNGRYPNRGSEQE